ncbi:endolytic transglycosylase MltG [Patescibacteria group bacterium]|nr:endolytic transglycosylase MltG [Patescibacteria group bacterium]
MRSFIEYLCAATELHCARMRPVYMPLGLAVVIALAVLWYFLFLPPAGFPTEKVVTIEESMTLRDVAELLTAERIISDELPFIAFMRLTGRENAVQAGPYAFNERYGLITIADRLARGVSGIPLIRLRIEEGATAREIGNQLAEKIENFDHVAFDQKARALEGYLFPDTYLLLPDEEPDEILERLYNNFVGKTESLEEELVAFDRPLREVLTMASLLEREARYLEEKQMIAGILWHRLEIGMPLQVDAVFGYINDRPTYSPSFDDLEIDSPYNTYLYRGLPPGPIANPGLESIEAAITPTETEYLYYLTGQDGEMRYARTFEEHKRNRALYLD